MIPPTLPSSSDAPGGRPARRAPRQPQAVCDALGALGDAVALIDTDGDAVLHQSPAMHALLALPAPGHLDPWARALPGLTEGLAAARSGRRQWRCGEQQGLVAEAVPLDERHLLLRLADERERQRERLRELQRQLDDRERLLFTSRSVSVGEMGSTLAHELNQPIGAAANLLRGLRVRLARRVGQAPAADEELAAVERAIEQVMFAARVITRIREFTHSRAPHLQTVDLGELMRSSASLLDWDLQRVGVRLTLALPAQPVPVQGDEVMLQQVLVNLLRNAIDALRDRPPPEPEVVLALRQERGEAVASVSDNGIGLAADAEARMFVPFASTKPSGMGIGLSICRSFVELHQGRLWFSRPAGRGCSFHISLPLHAAQPLSAGEPTP